VSHVQHVSKVKGIYTNWMEQGPRGELMVTQLVKKSLAFYVHNSAPLVPNLGQMNPAHKFPP